MLDTAFASGEQKSRRWVSSDFRALAEPANFTVLERNNNFSAGSRQAQINLTKIKANQGKSR
jgi:hypothetical protein